MKTIRKDRQCKSNGCRARIYDTDAGGTYPVHGAVEYSEGNWIHRAWTKEGRYRTDGSPHPYDLIEALKPNGIPVDLPDPPEVEGYRWEERGWGWKSDEKLAWNSVGINRESWIANDPKTCVHKTQCRGHKNRFYIEYLPIIEVEEMTLDAAISEALGRNIKIKQ